MNNYNFMKKIIAGFIITINIGTLFFVSPLSQNLSDLGNALGHRMYLILWATTSSLYFGVYTRNLMKCSCYNKKIGIFLLYLSCFGMIFSVFLPYAPYQYPNLSKWHTRIAMGSTITFVLLFYHYIYDLMYKDYVTFMKIMKLYTSLVVFDLLLYLLNGGVSTLLEISFTIGLVLLLPYAQSLFKK